MIALIFALPVIFAIAFLPLWLGPLIGWLKIPSQKRDPNGTIVRMVINLFDHKGWTNDGFVYRHVTGVSIWVANDDYGLAINLDGTDPKPSKGQVDLNPYWRGKLYEAIQADKARYKAEKLSAGMAEFADNVIKFVSKGS